MPKFALVGALSKEIDRREVLKKTEKRYIHLNRRYLRILTDNGFTGYYEGDNQEWEVHDHCTPVAIHNLHGGWFYPDFLVKSGLKNNNEGFRKERLDFWFMLAGVPEQDGVLHVGPGDYRIIIQDAEVAQVRLWGRKDFMDPDPVIELPNEQWELLNEGRNSSMFNTARDVFNHVKNMKNKGLL
jgi:hypothetical protein